jgi:hypothetical protein
MAGRQKLEDWELKIYEQYRIVEPNIAQKAVNTRATAAARVALLLDRDMKEHVDFILLAAPSGATKPIDCTPSDGIGKAMMLLARRFDIPYFNICNAKTRQALIDFYTPKFDLSDPKP